MGSLYRSEVMAKCQMFVETDSSYNCLAELGEIGVLQFQDLNENVNTYQRKYVSEVRRCEEMERKLRFLMTEVKNDSIPIVDTNSNPPAPAPSQMTEMETLFEKLELQMKDSNTNLTTLKQNYLELIELKHVLLNVKLVFQENRADLQSSDGQDVGKLGFIAGVIATEKIMGMERLLWFASRGNALMKQVQIEQLIEDPKSGSEVMKSVIFIFFQGDQLKSKVKKICDGFHATVYQCPDTLSEAQDKLIGVNTRIEDLNVIVNQTKDYRRHQLAEIAESIREWMMKVRKIKAIYFTLNCFNQDIAQKCMVGECWCPITHFNDVKRALRRGTDKSGLGSSAAILNEIDSSNEVPPTYNRTNKFTKVFQGIVESYGIATYQEVNPAPFIMITFPFLFSLMFGDAGHGALVFLAALWMVLWEKSLGAMKSNNEIWNIFFGGRYIILLMGLFSIYSGFIYNDIFAKPVNIFGSAWNANPSKYPLRMLESTKDFTMNPLSEASTPNITDYRGYPFPFGMDPVWQMSLNKITWLNSFKMKVSIIFGVCQMFFGVILSVFNHRHFKDPINIFCEFIPEMLFLMCMFGYLVVLILYKWIEFDATMAGCSPSLLINLINMFLYNYSSEKCQATNFYTNQQTFQTILVLVVVVCIPWLLLPKPFLLKRRWKNQQKAKVGNDTDVAQLFTHIELQEEKTKEEGEYEMPDEKAPAPAIKPAAAHGGGGGGGHGGHGDEFNFGDVFIHQCIHTIEYCLGCISHTASYLRLWALSLAHAELSEVLWTMVLHNGFTIGGMSGSPYVSCISIFIIWTPWACLTIAILLLMEGLSAFLHTLRLHWVEFQSKFYKGEGYKFEPFSFKKILKKAEQE